MSRLFHHDIEWILQLNFFFNIPNDQTNETIISLNNSQRKIVTRNMRFQSFEICSLRKKRTALSFNSILYLFVESFIKLSRKNETHFLWEFRWICSLLALVKVASLTPIVARNVLVLCVYCYVSLIHRNYNFGFFSRLIGLIIWKSPDFQISSLDLQDLPKHFQYTFLHNFCSLAWVIQNTCSTS